MLLLITATAFLFSANCNKNVSIPCRGGNAGYSFSVTSEFSRQNEVYNVGDTIFLTSAFSKTLTNLITNTGVDYSNSINITGNLTTSLMDTSTHLITDAPIGSFIIFPLVGTTSEIINKPEKGVNLFYFENSLTYDLHIGIKLTKKGLFQLAVTDLGSQGIRGKNCTNAEFNMTVTNSNKNLNLFQYAIGYAPDGLLEKRIYCFRVN